MSAEEELQALREDYRSMGQLLAAVREDYRSMGQLLAAVLLAIEKPVFVGPYELQRCTEAVLVKEEHLSGGCLLSARILGRDESAVADASVPRLAS